MNLKCNTCGADTDALNGHSSLPDVEECLNCYQTRWRCIFTMYDHLPRTDEQIIKMVATLAVDGDVEIPHLTERLEELCDPGGAPVDLHWIHNDEREENHCAQFCLEHASALAAYFNGETEVKPKPVWEHAYIPDWPPSPGSVSVGGGRYRIESETARNCECCGRKLAFSPLDDFVIDEMIYYMGCEVIEDWWSFRIFLEAALDYSKEPDWYARVVLLAHKWVPMDKIRQGEE